MENPAATGNAGPETLAVQRPDHDVGKTEDTRRARELYKYYQPPSTLSATRSSETDTVLSAHMQLVVYRLNVQRAAFSVIDREQQYFLAESRQTTELDRPSEDRFRDAAWFGCNTEAGAAHLCEYTLKAQHDADGTPPCFEVRDIRADERFWNMTLAQVTADLRSYVGVPVVTKRGIRIGTLFAMDDKPRSAFSSDDKRFLWTMADNIMTHLETTRETTERRRALKMNSCLAAFVDPEHQTRKRKRSTTKRVSVSSEPIITDGSSGVGVQHAKDEEEAVLSGGCGHTRPQFSPQTSFESPCTPLLTLHSSAAIAKESRTAGSRRAEDWAPTKSVPPDMPLHAGISTPRKPGEDDMVNTFKRAASLLHQSLSLDNGGGVVFLDTMSTLDDDNDNESDADFDNAATGSLFNGSSTTSSLGADPVGGRSKRSPRATVLSALETTAGSTPKLTRTKALPTRDLRKLIKHHPRGKAFVLDFDDNSSNPSVEEGAAVDFGAVEPTETEAALMLEYFPNARQVIFLPLWDSTSSRWFICFIYNTWEYLDITSHADFMHCIAFCNCIMTEICRLATLMADQQKSDFIGSISHELRSPLHGILASMEFLADSECTSFQQSLIDTADSCARTLLDTINNVLDYSRLNAFEKDQNKARKSGRNKIDYGNSSIDKNMVNIYEEVDLAAITEEVVEGVATGQLFKDITKISPKEGKVNPRGMDSQRRFVPDGPQESRKLRRADVEIIIDVGVSNWNYVTQPGAFRRIVMNLFGNSLKYTQSGYIRVKVDTEASSPQDSGKRSEQDERTTDVILTVTDTGRGISPEYLRNKLFVPFAQESSLNPGTGLGLSLVKGLVHSLNGDINVRSTLGVGTEVSVRLPMSTNASRTQPNTPSTANTISTDGPIPTRRNSLNSAKAAAVGRRVAIFWQDRTGDSAKQVEAGELMRKTLRANLNDWFGFESVNDWSPGNQVDAILVPEWDLAALVEQLQSLELTASSRPVILVGCTSASRLASSEAYANVGAVKYMTMPLGPYKIAQAIRSAFERRVELDLEPSVLPVMPISEMSADDPATIQPLVEALQNAVLVSPTDAQKAGAKLDLGEHADGSGRSVAETTLPETISTVGPKEQPAFPFPNLVDATNTARDLPTPPYKGTPRPTPSISTSATGSMPTPSLNGLEKPPKESSQRTPRLLLVDDNAINLRILRTYMLKLRLPDSCIFTARDGAEAVDVFQQQSGKDESPDIVFMDISMPVMDGLEATRKIRKFEKEAERSRRSSLANIQEIESHSPKSGMDAGRSAGAAAKANRALIIAFTGLASARDRSEAFASGVDVFLTKPVRFKEVGKLVEGWKDEER